MNKQEREIMKLLAIQLQGCVDCESWDWDYDQQEAAEETIRDADGLIERSEKQTVASMVVPLYHKLYQLREDQNISFIEEELLENIFAYMVREHSSRHGRIPPI